MLQKTLQAHLIRKTDGLELFVGIYIFVYIWMELHR